MAASKVRKGSLAAPTIESPISGDMAKRQIGTSPLHRLISINIGDEEPNSVPVTQNSVLSIAPYWRATNILCGLVGRIRINLARKARGNKLVVQHDDNRNFLVSKKPHRHLKSRTWRKTLMLHAQITPGGGFSEVIRDPETGDPLAILPLDPNRVGWGVLFDENNRPLRTVYVYQDDPSSTECRPIQFDDMIHIKGLSYDSIMGIDTTNLLQREFGLILARQNYTRKYYVGNAKIRGFLMVPAGTDMNLYANMMQVIKDHMEQQDADPLKTVPLFDGVKYQPTQDSPENSELTESLRMTPDTCAVITGVPAFFLGADTRDSYNSLEKVMQGFFTTTVGDWFDEFETELDDKLLTEEQLRKGELGFRFSRDQLMATDVLTFHKMLREDMHAGLLAWEECREQLDMTTDESDLTFMVPQNVVGAQPSSLRGLSGNAAADDAEPNGGNPSRNGSGSPARKRRKAKRPSISRKSALNKALQHDGAIARLAVSTAQRVCNRISNAAVAKSGNVDKFEGFLAALDVSREECPERDIETSHMAPVFDVAIEAGLLNGPPEWTIVSRFRNALEAAINENHVSREFCDVVNEVCATTTREILDDLTNFLSADTAVTLEN